MSTRIYSAEHRLAGVKSHFGCLAELKPNNRAFRDTLRAQEAGKFADDEGDVVRYDDADADDGYDPNDPNHVAARMAHKRATMNSNDVALNSEINLVDHNSDLMRELYAAQHTGQAAKPKGSLVSPIPESAEASPVPTIDITGGSMDWSAGEPAAPTAKPLRMQTIEFETIDSRPGSSSSLSEQVQPPRAASRGMNSRGSVGSRGGVSRGGVSSRGGPLSTVVQGSRQGSRGSVMGSRDSGEVSTACAQYKTMHSEHAACKARKRLLYAVSTQHQCAKHIHAIPCIDSIYGVLPTLMSNENGCIIPVAFVLCVVRTAMGARTEGVNRGRRQGKARWKYCRLQTVR